MDAPTARRGWYGSFDLTKPATFTYFTEESLRFADLDRNGHVNNVAFTTFFENTRVRHLTDVVKLPHGEHVGSVLAHLSIDYLAQLFYPGHVRSGVRVVEVRKSSLVLGQAVFRDGQATATGHAVMVVIDKRSGKALAFDDEQRAKLEAMVRGMSADGDSTVNRTGVPDGFEAFNPRDDFVGHNGPLWLKPETDGLRVGLLVEQRHCNPMGVVHGGMMMTLADMVMGMGCGFATGIRFPHPTISMNCDFIRGPKIGQFVEGKSRIARRTRNLIFCSCELVSDGETMLTASGVFKMPNEDKIPDRYKVKLPPYKRPS